MKGVFRLLLKANSESQGWYSHHYFLYFISTLRLHYTRYWRKIIEGKNVIKIFRNKDGNYEEFERQRIPRGFLQLCFSLNICKNSNCIQLPELMTPPNWKILSFDLFLPLPSSKQSLRTLIGTWNFKKVRRQTDHIQQHKFFRSNDEQM